MASNDARGLQITTNYLTHLPKAELHLHLEGTISPATLVSLSQRHDKVPLTLAEAEALYVYKDFGHFLEVWSLVCQRIRAPEDYAIIVHDMLESLAKQGVKHAEVFVAVGGIISTRAFLNVGDVFAAVEASRVEASARLGISVLWIIDASRGDGVEHVRQVFNIAAELKQRYPAVVGVGIGGNEAAAEATGPVDGPKDIWDALDMGVERLGHAFYAQYDEALLKGLKRTRIPLELKVTSNVRTGACLTVKDHPIKRYHDHGLMCTITSDDPAMFGSDVLGEYLLVHDHLDFSLDEMKRFAESSFRSSF